MSPNNTGQQPETGDDYLVDMPSTRDPLIGKVVSDRYRILERIGLGGFGAVYKVQHIRLDKILALKVLFEHTHQNPRMIKRFEREARATCRIGHENIVEITDFARDRRIGYYFVMEYLIGETLCDRLRKTGPMDPRHVVRIGTQIADALAATHTKGIIHRDLKPDNIFLVDKRKQTDFIKILDFGIAAMNDLEEDVPRLTRHGTMLGTPSYMAPEQAEGKLADQRADIYSLGIILYEMTTGNVPFRNASSLAVLEMHRSTPPVPPRQACPELNIPHSLEQIILRGLRKELPERYQSMREIYNDLLTEEKKLGPIEDSAGMMTVIDSKPEPDQDDRTPGQLEWLDDDVIELDANVVELVAEDEWSEENEPIAVTELFNEPATEPYVQNKPNVTSAPNRTVVATPNSNARHSKPEVPSIAESDRKTTDTDRKPHPKPSSPSIPFWRSPWVLVVTGFLLMAALYGILLVVSETIETAEQNTTSDGMHPHGDHTPPHLLNGTNQAIEKSNNTTKRATQTADGTIISRPVVEEAPRASRRPSDATPERRRPASPIEVQPNSLWVRLDIQTMPSAVSVYWQGKKQGKTPITLRIPRAKSETTITLKRTGYRKTVQRIVPSEDRTLEIRMSKKPTYKNQPYSPAPKPAKTNDDYELF